MRTNNTRASRVTALVALTAAASVGLGGVATADIVYNDVDASIDAEVESYSAAAGSAPRSVSYRIDQTNGDGKNGCDFQGGESMTATVTSSAPTVATVSPGSVTFTACGDVKTVQVTPVAQGSATISLSQQTSSTGTTFNFAPATFTVNVTQAAPANTAPQVSVSGVEDGERYRISSVPTPGCSVVDAEDTNESATPQISNGAYNSLGSHTVTCSYTDGGNITRSAQATYEVIRDLDTTAPAISYTLNPAEPDGTNGWYRGDVTLDWTVSETQSPETLQTTGCDDVTVSADQDLTRYTCSATSEGGSDSRDVSLKRDGTAPTVRYSRLVSGTLGLNGWYTSAVTVEFSATDARSGVAPASKQVTSTTEGAAVVIDSPSFTDGAGNTTAAGADESPAFKIDTQAPNAPSVSMAPLANGNGWNNSNVTVSFAGNGDNGDSGGVTCTSDVVVSSETAGQTVSGTCTDAAGNESAATSITVKLDKTAPTDVTFIGGPESGSRYFPNNTPAQPTCQATDLLSGGVTCEVTGYSTAVGTHTLTATATDAAGNQATASRTYTVRRLTLEGFFAPVDMGGTANTVKAGSTVPLKFRVYDAGTEQKSIDVIKGFTTKVISCTSLTGSEYAIEELVYTNATGVRYDTTGGQFIQNWKTPSKAGTCYTVTMTTIDDSTISANFKLK